MHCLVSLLHFGREGHPHPSPSVQKPCKAEGAYISILLLTVLFGEQANVHLPLLPAPPCCLASLGDDRHQTAQRTEGTTLI